MRCLAAVLVVVLLTVALSGCLAASPAGSSPIPSWAVSGGRAGLERTRVAGTEKPSEKPTKASGDKAANFSQTFTYADDVKVEVTKIKHGKVAKVDAGYTKGVTPGKDYVELTVKVKNSGTKRLKDMSSYQTVTFGPEGDKALEVYLSTSRRNYDSVGGSLSAGEAKVALLRLAIPAKYQDDVQLRFDFDSSHEAAVFAGSVK